MPGLELRFDISPGLAATTAAEVKAGERAVAAAMREAGTGLNTAWRGQIAGARLGRRRANSICDQTYPAISLEGGLACLLTPT